MADSAQNDASSGAEPVPVLYKGRVKLFSLERGYGFIKPDAPGPDVYFLRVNVEKPKGFLRTGDYVRYEIVKTDKGPTVMHIRLLNADGTEADDHGT